MSGYHLKRKCSFARRSAYKVPRTRRAYKPHTSARRQEWPSYTQAIDRFNPRNAMTFTGNSCFPQRYNNVMHYRERWNVTDANGYVSYTYGMNAAYDPYVAAGGVTCHGWDKMIAIYNRYMVTASKIQVTYVNLDENDPVELMIAPSYDSVSAGSYTAGQPDSRHIIVTNQAGKETCSHYRTIKSMSFPVVNEADLTAANNANPTKLYFWQIRLDGTNATALNGQLEVDIWFHTTWYDLLKTDPVI